MATTTTNFGWDIPQSTDLVKDGATAIAALGQDIDTAFVDFKGGTTGQVLKKTSGTDLDVEWGTPSSGLTLINTTSFSGVTSQSINDVFSATYDNYKILINWTATSQSSAFIRLRVSGADNSTASQYSWGETGIEFDGGASANSGGASATYFNLEYAGTNGASADLILFAPFLTKPTFYSGMKSNFWTNSTDSFLRSIAGVHNQSTSFTGFTIGNGTSMTGTVSVYGFNK